MGAGLRTSAGALLTESGILIPGQVRHLDGVLTKQKTIVKIQSIKIRKQWNLKMLKSAIKKLLAAISISSMGRKSKQLLKTHTQPSTSIWIKWFLSLLSSIRLPGLYCLQMSYILQQTTQPLLPSLHTAWPSVQKPLTWGDLLCQRRCCKQVLVLLHLIPGPSRIQRRKGQHQGTERPFQSCLSVGKNFSLSDKGKNYLSQM